jgi:serine/threonine protein phosphatase PrpC
MNNVESLKVLGAGVTDQGLVRQENQDAFYLDLEKGLFIVADGMGGHAAGATASKRVIERLPGLVAHELSRFSSGERPIADAQIGLALRKAAIKLNAIV